MKKTLSGLWQVKPEGNGKSGKQCWWVSKIILVCCAYYFSEPLCLTITLLSEAKAMTLMIPAVFDGFMPARRMSNFISCTKYGINKLQVKLYDFEWMRPCLHLIFRYVFVDFVDHKWKILNCTRLFSNISLKNQKKSLHNPPPPIYLGMCLPRLLVIQSNKMHLNTMRYKQGLSEWVSE